MTDIRPATADDLPRIEQIYDAIHTAEETGAASVGWARGSASARPPSCRAPSTASPASRSPVWKNGWTQNRHHTEKNRSP